MALPWQAKVTGAALSMTLGAKLTRINLAKSCGQRGHPGVDRACPLSSLPWRVRGRESEEEDEQVARVPPARETNERLGSNGNKKG